MDIKLDKFYTKAELEEVHSILTLLTKKLHNQPEQPEWIQAVATHRNIDVKYFNEMLCFFIPDLEYLRTVIGESFYTDTRLGFLSTRGYSTFKARFIFPIWNLKGKVVGFVGYDCDSPSYKYLLSTTIGFEKSYVTLGYDYLDFIYKSDYVILVEGMMDYIRIKSLGYPVYCLQGTFLYPNSRRIISRLSNTITLLDTDDAGIEGVQSLTKLLPHNTDIQLNRYGLKKLDADLYLSYKENVDHFATVINQIKENWLNLNYTSQFLNNYSPALKDRMDKALIQLKELEVQKSKAD